jgi:membrane-associated phospholipid phosphatase
MERKHAKLTSRAYVLPLALLALCATARASDADSALRADLEAASTALQSHNRERAAGELQAASDDLRGIGLKSVSFSGVATQYRRLRTSAEELELLSQAVQRGDAIQLQQINDAADRAYNAAAAVRGAELPPVIQSPGLGTLFRDVRSDFKHLPSWDSLLVSSVGGGLVVGLHRFDPTLNRKLANIGGVFSAGNILGNTGTVAGASAAAYLVGRLTGHDGLADTAFDLLRAEILTEGMVEPLKHIVQRSRPDASNGYSFPSGHAAMMLATATVIQRRHGFRWAVPAYGLATYVAMSRLHDNLHYLTDIVSGAAVGVMAGRTVTRNGTPRFAIVPVAAPGVKGLALIHTW